MTGQVSICLCLASFSLYLTALYHFAFRIKSKKSNPVPEQRQTLAKRIRELASTDVEAALGLAKLGKELTEIQTLLKRYYLAKADCERIERGEKGEIQKIFEKISGNIGKMTILIFIIVS